MQIYIFVCKTYFCFLQKKRKEIEPMDFAVLLLNVRLASCIYSYVNALKTVI